jgi:hypothetical protein
VVKQGASPDTIRKRRTRTIAALLEAGLQSPARATFTGCAPDPFRVVVQAPVFAFSGSFTILMNLTVQV